MTQKQTDPQFKLRLPTELKEQIEQAAAESNRSMNAEIVARLEYTFRASPLSQEDIARFAEIVEMASNFYVMKRSKNERTVMFKNGRTAVFNWSPFREQKTEPESE